MKLGAKLAAIVGMLLASLSSLGYAQSAGGPFVGTWKGEVPGISEATMIITAVGSNGQVEGTMEFAAQSFTATFADKYDVARQTNHGVVSGSTLTIDTALGGRYMLRLEGDRLNGRYIRGTSYDVPVTFRKS
jgi:hypothetical protein